MTTRGVLAVTSSRNVGVLDDFSGVGVSDGCVYGGNRSDIIRVVEVAALHVHTGVCNGDDLSGSFQVGVSKWSVLSTGSDGTAVDDASGSVVEELRSVEGSNG